MQAKTGKALSAIEKTCKGRGQTLTAPRRLVLKCLLEAKAPLKAYDIVEKLGDVRPMTVYRALEFLCGAGYAHRIESLNAYVSCAESHCAHTNSQYLICEACGHTEEFHNHGIDDFIKKQLARSGFALTSKIMEMRGLCAACRE